MPAISVLIKPSSGMCNLQCDYCFYCDETEKRLQASYGFMSEETLKNVIRKTILRAEAMISYVFQGGEPTLRGLDFYKKVIEYEHQYNRHHIQVNNALQTNGYLLNDEWCQFLIDYNFLVGLVPLNSTAHKLVHNQQLNIHPDLVLGDWEKFYNLYQDYASDSLKKAMDDAKFVQNNTNSDAYPTILIRSENKFIQHDIKKLEEVNISKMLTEIKLKSMNLLNSK